MNLAAIVIFQKENKILLFKRQNTGWEDGKYGTVAGFIRNEETPTEAAIRESKEELGIDLKAKELDLVHVGFVRNEIINFYFLVKNWSGEPELLEADLSTDLKWFDMVDLPDIAANGAEVLEYIKNNKFYSEV